MTASDHVGTPVEVRKERRAWGLAVFLVALFGYWFVAFAFMVLLVLEVFAQSFSRQPSLGGLIVEWGFLILSFPLALPWLESMYDPSNPFMGAVALALAGNGILWASAAVLAVRFAERVHAKGRRPG
jgi:hypothetical protein